MEAPLVSVIVPSINDSVELGTCLQSLMNQTYNNIEIIVAGQINQQVLRLYQIKYCQVEDSSLINCLNTGLHAAQGDYLTFQLPNQRAQPQRIEKSIKHISIVQSHQLGQEHGELEPYSLLFHQAVFQTIGYLDEGGIHGYMNRLAAAYWQNNSLSESCQIPESLITNLVLLPDLIGEDISEPIINTHQSAYRSFGSQKSVSKMCSIISCTNKSQCFRNIFLNYTRQKYANKELILVINALDLRPKMKQQLIHFPDIRPVVICLAPEITLGECLNVAISRANGEYMSKFDDDDYYGADYLKNNLVTLEKHKAKLSGRNKLFIYLQGKIREYGFAANKKTHWLAGPTITFRRSVSDVVRFLPRNTGEDSGFLRTCHHLGYLIYATPLLKDFVYIRYHNNWSNPQTEFLEKSTKVKVVLERKLLSQINNLVSYQRS